MPRKILHEENSRTILTIFTAPATKTKTFPQYLAAFLGKYFIFYIRKRTKKAVVK